MEQTIATIQPIWDCRWSRLGHRLSGVHEHAGSELVHGKQLSEPTWVCVRERGVRRWVTEEECATCKEWEPASAPEC